VLCLRYAAGNLVMVSRLHVNLPKTQIDLNRSMSAKPGIAS
jgi:hypothetical protein